jgi:hypothetical protein
MAEPFGAQPEKPKADGVADGINRLLQNLVLKCAKGDGIRDYFHGGVIGYGGRVVWALAGNLAGQKLVPISVLATNPLKVEERTGKVSDGSSGLVEQTFKFPVWFQSVAGGRTPRCQAITEANQAIAAFIGRFPKAFPPLVINISDGKATDGNPELPAEQLRKLASSDGNVSMFNAHLSSTPTRPIEFPSQESLLPDPDAGVLFRMSSILPLKLREAKAKKYGVPLVRLRCPPCAPGTCRGHGFCRFADPVGAPIDPHESPRCGAFAGPPGFARRCDRPVVLAASALPALPGAAA